MEILYVDSFKFNFKVKVKYSYGKFRDEIKKVVNRKKNRVISCYE